MSLIDLKYTDSIKLMSADPTNIRLIHDTADMCAIENILEPLVHSQVKASPTFSYGSESDPPSPLNDSSSEIATPKGNLKPRNNPTNLVLFVPSDSDSDPNSLDSSLSELFDSSENEYYKQRRRSKKDNNKHQSKTQFDEPIKKCVKLTAKLVTDAYK